MALECSARWKVKRVHAWKLRVRGDGRRLPKSGVSHVKGMKKMSEARVVHEFTIHWMERPWCNPRA